MAIRMPQRVMGMKLLRIKDNSRSQKSFFSPIENLTAKIADKTLEQLEGEGVFVFPGNLQRMEDLTAEQMILQGINDAYQTGNVMGFLGCRRLKTGTQYLPVDSIQTSWQSLSRSHCLNSRIELLKVEKRFFW